MGRFTFINTFEQYFKIIIENNFPTKFCQLSFGSILIYIISFSEPTEPSQKQTFVLLMISLAIEVLSVGIAAVDDSQKFLYGPGNSTDLKSVCSKKFVINKISKVII